MSDCIEIGHSLGMFLKSMLKSFFYSLGKILQFVALLQVASALFIGFDSHDATLELKLMLFGVLEFFAGTLLLRYTSSQGS